MTDSNAKYPRTVRPVTRLLRRRYEDFAHYNMRDPYRELVFIFCSTLTRESSYRRVYASFIRRFPSPATVARASMHDLRKVLDPGGLGKRKAALVSGLFASLMDTWGVGGLRAMRRLDDASLERALIELPGIGKKSARCVMLYSFDREVFPVDTHCWRMAKRLGWIRGATLTPKMMDTLQGKIPPELRFSLHVNMLSHGREICRARNPRCQVCIVNELCPKIGVRKSRRG